MDAALQKRVQRYGWDKAAAYYENFWQKQLKPAQDLLLEMAELTEGENVLDIACGTGLVSFRSAMQVGPTGSVLGTDISDKMIESANRIALDKGYSNISFAQMDAESLKLEDDTFDVVLCSLGLMYIPDVLQSLNEMYRVLRPGGRIVSAVWGQRDQCGWAEIFEIVDRRVTSEVCPMFFNLGSNDLMHMYYEKTGFSDIEMNRISSMLQYNSAEEACGAAFEGGPVALAYFKFPQQVQAEVKTEYLASIASYKTIKGFEVPGEFVVAKGYK